MKKLIENGEWRIENSIRPYLPSITSRFIFKISNLKGGAREAEGGLKLVESGELRVEK
jgi:hypothetical protein